MNSDSAPPPPATVSITANHSFMFCSVTTIAFEEVQYRQLLLKLLVLRKLSPSYFYKVSALVNFDPRGAAFDLSPHNLCHEVRMAAKKVLVSWRSLGEPERSRVVTSLEEGKNYRQKYFQSFLMSSEGRK